MYNYLKYNREERNACSHLFRVLHEPHNDFEMLHKFLGGEHKFTDFNIFSEVALLRDAFHMRKKDNCQNEFMNDFFEIVSAHFGINNCKLYSELVHGIKPIPHPHRLPWKTNNFLELSEAETTVYAEVQSIFNAKPDLAITIDNTLFVYEVKLTQSFDNAQLKRTELIGKIWAELLFKDLGFSTKPAVKYVVLGLEKHKTDNMKWKHLTWETVSSIVNNALPENDKSRIAIYNASRLD